MTPSGDSFDSAPFATARTDLHDLLTGPVQRWMTAGSAGRTANEYQPLLTIPLDLAASGFTIAIRQPNPGWEITLQHAIATKTTLQAHAPAAPMPRFSSSSHTPRPESSISWNSTPAGEPSPGAMTTRKTTCCLRYRLPQEQEPLMHRRYQKPRDVPKSKRLVNNPYATRGVKLQRLTGGLIIRRRLPDGRTIVTISDENGKQQTYIEQEAPHGNN